MPDYSTPEGRKAAAKKLLGPKLDSVEQWAHEAQIILIERHLKAAFDAGYRKALYGEA